jgi:hypothetical protein
MTPLTEPDLIAHPDYRLPETLNVAGVKLQKMQYQPQRGLFTDTRKTGKLSHSLLQ